MVEETNMCTYFVVRMLSVRLLYFGDRRRMLSLYMILLANIMLMAYRSVIWVSAEDARGSVKEIIV
jgi:hypothetical protein